VIRLAKHNIDVIAPQKNMKAKLPTISAVAAGVGWIHGGTELPSIHLGTKTMRRMRGSIGTVGLLVFGMAAFIAGAGAEDQGACGQIRAACQGAGFVEGAAREGIGLQIHCIIPIMRASAQPLTAGAISGPGYGQVWSLQTRAVECQQQRSAAHYCFSLFSP